MKEVNMMSEKEKKLEFIDLYEKYLSLTNANRTLILGMIIGLQYGQAKDDSVKAKTNKN